MKQRDWAIAAFLLPLGSVSQASADEWTFTPRAWLLFDGVVRPQGTDTDTDGSLIHRDTSSATEAEPFTVVMYGGSASYYAERAETSFTLTAVHGSGSETIKRVQFERLPDLTVVDFEQELDFDRTDVELTAQRQLDSGLGVMAGARYENFDGRGRGVERVNLDDVSQNYVLVSDGAYAYDAYSVRAGLAATSPPFAFDVKLYGNLQLFAGRRDQKQDAKNRREVNPTNGATISCCFDVSFDRETYYFGPDIAAGLLIPLGDKLALDFRYRTLIYYDFQSDRPDVEIDSPRVTHGLNVGLSVRF